MDFTKIKKLLCIKGYYKKVNYKKVKTIFKTGENTYESMYLFKV